MKTKAIVFVSKENVSIQELDIPPPGAHQIQVRSRYSGISAGTEGWILRDLMTRVPIHYPCVPGYQRSGIVTAIGPDVAGWQIGDRVFTETGIWSNPEVSCVVGGHIGHANAPTDLSYHLPDEVDDVDASFGVVAQVGYNAASRARFENGEWVLVYGDGMVGQCAALAARAGGARVILAGHRSERLILAARYCADVTIDSATQDVLTAVRKVTGNQTIPVVLDSVQSTHSQKEYINLLEPGRGQIICCGFTPGDRWADMGALQHRELTVHFVSGVTRGRLEATLTLMAAKKLCIAPLITHLVSYRRGPEMYRMIADKSASFLGITLDWSNAHED